MAFCHGMFGELVQIVDFECDMREIGADDNRAAPIEFAYLNFLLAAWCFQENELGPASGSMATHLLQSENILVERNGLFQVVYAIARVQ